MNKRARLTIELTYNKTKDRKIIPVQIQSEILDLETGEKYQTEEGETTREGWALAMASITFAAVAYISDMATRFTAFVPVLTRRFFDSVNQGLTDYHTHDNRPRINPN